MQLVRIAACLVVATSASQAQSPITGRVADATGTECAATLHVRWRVHPELPGLVGHSLGDRGLAERLVAVGDDGRFRFSPDHRGPFQLVARADGQSSAQVFPVMAGDQRELRLEPDFRFGGRVVGIDGNPVTHVSVRFVPHRQSWTRLALYRLPERRARTVTDAEGRFSLWFAHGYARELTWPAFVSPWVEAPGLANAAAPVYRPIESASMLELKLSAARLVRGVVQDEDGFPLAGAEVRDPLLPGSAILSDERGEYELPMPVDRRYVINGMGKASVDVRVGIENKVRIETALSVGVALRARLVDADRSPLARARVLVARVRGRGPPEETVHRTDADGRLHVAHLPVDRAMRAFVGQGGGFTRFFAGQLAASRDLGEVVVTSGRELRGRVVSADRAPLASTRVVLFPRPRSPDAMPRVTYTDRAGRFAFGRVVDAEVAVIAGGGPDGFVARRLGAKALGDAIELTMPAGLSIDGVVHGGDGRPVAAARITAVLKGPAPEDAIPAPTLGSVTLCVISDAAGRFRLRGLRDGQQWQLICNYIRDGALGGGGTTAAAGATEVVLQTRILTR